jgi:hypothetical protein
MDDPLNIFGQVEFLREFFTASSDDGMPKPERGVGRHATLVGRLPLKLAEAGRVRINPMETTRAHLVQCFPRYEDGHEPPCKQRLR